MRRPINIEEEVKVEEEKVKAEEVTSGLSGFFGGGNFIWILVILAIIFLFSGQGYGYGYSTDK